MTLKEFLDVAFSASPVRLHFDDGYVIKERADCVLTDYPECESMKVNSIIADKDVLVIGLDGAIPEYEDE
jgi:hypothetical protein